MSSKKDKKRKKNGSKSEAGVDQVGDKASEEQLKRPEASERLSDLPRYLDAWLSLLQAHCLYWLFILQKRSKSSTWFTTKAS